MANAFNKEVGYMTLFPETEFNNITEAYSTFGAAAYFKYLMGVASKLALLNLDDTQLLVHGRRRDLLELLLTQDNCDQEVPYLSLVNAAIAYERHMVSWLSTGSLYFISYNIYVEQINVCLKTFGSSLSEFTSLFEQDGINSMTWATAELGLALTDINILNDPKVGYGEDTLNAIDNPKKMCIITNMDQSKLYQLIYNGKYESNDTELLKLYINIGYRVPLKLSESIGIKGKYRIRVFLILARATGWAFEDLYAVLAFLENPVVFNKDTLLPMAQLCYLSRQWNMAPKKLVEAIKSNNLYEIATKLGVSPALLLSAKGSKEILPSIFNAQKNKELLETLHVSLTDYMSILATANLEIDNERLNAFLINLSKKLKETDSKINTLTKETDRDTILFKQWVEEFAAFAGLHSVDLYNLISSSFEKITIKSLSEILLNDLPNTYQNHQTLLETKMRGAYVEQTYEKVELHPDYIYMHSFFHSIIPYALLVDKLHIDDEGIKYLSTHILKKNKDTLQKLTEDLAKPIIEFASLYNSLSAPLKLEFIKSYGNTDELFNIFELSDISKKINELWKPNLAKYSESTFSRVNQLLEIKQLSVKTKRTINELIDSYKQLSFPVDLGIPAVSWFEALKEDKKSVVYSTFRQHWGRQLEAERDALMSSALWLKNELHSDIDTLDHYSDYKLIDVEMSGNMNITPLREATDAVQTYIMRCKSGLEILSYDSKVALAAIKPNDWTCISNFRIWQAEEILKVFPENYLLTEARSNATDLFKKTIDALRSNELKKEDAKNAVLKYLDEWVDLINAPIVELVKCKTNSSHFEGKEVDTIFLVSKSITKENSFNFCYRDQCGDQIHWTQWKEIPIQINAKHLSAIFAFNRWHIFWNEIHEEGNQESTKSIVTLKCIYQNIDDSWSNIKTVRQNTAVTFTENGVLHFRKYEDIKFEIKFEKEMIQVQFGKVNVYIDNQINNNTNPWKWLQLDNQFNNVGLETFNSKNSEEIVLPEYIGDIHKKMNELRKEAHLNDLGILHDKKIINVENPTRKEEVKASFDLYHRELFFHLPMAVAELFVNDLQFEEAKKWYHYVFNPIGVSEKNINDVWKYSPFKDKKSKTEIANCFDPDILASADLSIYMRWTVKRYINCIIEQGDNEFRKGTWEGLSAALQCYFEAEDLLGQEPEIKDRMAELTKDDKKRTYENKEVKFIVPTNPKLHELWTRVQDRLYKLRNGFNINGERQMPSTYGTAIDPARLLVAAKNGGINPYEESTVEAHRSVYRFRDLIPHTESLINLVVEFGAHLHSALVQKDSEHMQTLQATHHINMQNAIEQIYELQINETKLEIAALQKNKESIDLQLKHYKGLLEDGNLIEETLSLTANELALGFQARAAVMRGASAILHCIPNIYGMAVGGQNFGHALESGASALNEGGAVLQTGAHILATQADRKRREVEWAFQLAMSQKSLEHAENSLESTKIRLAIAQENMKQYKLSVKQANEVLNYLNNKFTNVELYTWMSQQLSSLYFTAYSLASSALHRLQEVYQNELDENDKFIPSNAWDSLKKGLLAGETLKLALARMHDAYLNKNKRRQEVEKIISLKKLMMTIEKTEKEEAKTTDVFTKCIKDGENLKFSLNLESLGRKGTESIVKIKSIAVSIPAVVGPYETFDAVLSNDKTGEQITISRGIEDMGVFADEMYDGRYLPFEGIKIDKEGTNSNWTLNIPDAKDKNISDVILNIKFTVKKF